MKIKARFKGAEGSMGYKAGKVYELYFSLKYNSHDSFSQHIIIENPIGEGLPCPYSSLRKFLNNWDVL